MRIPDRRRAVLAPLAAALLAALLLSGCGVAGLAAHPPRPDAVDPALAQAADRFGVSLLQAVAAARPGENLFLSPLSAQVILGLTANGARGATQAEMLEALGYGGMDLAAVNAANQDLRGLLADPDPRVAISTANAIWYQSGFAVEPSFRRVAEGEYGAEVQATRFGRPEAAEAINRWVSRRTRGRITELIRETGADLRMVLVNALYFKGEWEKQFNPGRTEPRPFHRLDGTEAEVPFMHQTETFGYLAEEGLVGVRLPYGGGDLALYVFMPDEWEGFVEGLTPERYQGWVAAMAEERVRLAFPKVRLTDRHQLNDALMALGMERAFDPQRADFSGLFEASEPLYIDWVIQNTFLEINEEGTEAAAATAVSTRSGSAPPRALPEVVLDRPFLLAIRDDRTGVTLFLGAIVDPAGAERRG